MADIFNLTDTWNNGATVFTAIKMDVTDTASDAASKLLDLLVGASSKFNVAKDGSFGGTGFAFSNTNKAITLGGATVTTSNPVLDATQTWNAAGVVFTGLKLNITNTSSAALSKLLDLQIGGTTVTGFTKEGYYIASGFGLYPVGTGGSITNIYAGSARIGGGAGVNTWRVSLSANSLGELIMPSDGYLSWSSQSGIADHRSTVDLSFYRDAADIIGQRRSTNAQESRIYGSYTSASNYQRMSIKTVREVSSTLSGATYTSTATIPAYAVLIGVTTRVNTVITGATTYSVGDGTDVDLWGASIAVAANSQSRSADFTAVGAVGATGAARNVVLTANGSNFTGGVVEICFHYLHTEAD